MRLIAIAHFRLVPPSQMKIAWLTRSAAARVENALPGGAHTA
jgi:hypothetical protein